MEFNCKDAEAVLMRVTSFSKANNVIYYGLSKFPIEMQQQFPIVLYVTYVPGKCLD